MNRRNLFLGLLLALQAVLIAVLFWPQPQAEGAGRLFPEFALEEVTGITLSYDGDTLALARGEGGWVLPEAGNFPVDEVKVTDLLTKVVQLDTSRLVASNTTSLTRLQVADEAYMRKVEIARADGDPLTLYVGSSPNARSTHVRNGSSDNVYLTPALTTADVRMDMAAWVDTLYLQSNSADVTALTLENPNGDFAFTRDAANAWSTSGLAAGESVNQSALDLLLNRLATLNFVDVLGTELLPEYGLGDQPTLVTLQIAPSSTVTTTAGSEAITLSIGSKDEVTERYRVKSSASDYVVDLSATTLDPFVQYGRSDLIVTPTITETAALTGTEAITPALEITPTDVLTGTQP